MFLLPDLIPVVKSILVTCFDIEKHKKHPVVIGCEKKMPVGKIYAGMLRVEDIIECSGISAVDTIEDLELLFLTCTEIASLDDCRSLKRLSMLDNGLQRISNLKPVGRTLTSLCLCDQLLTKIENLELPALTELLLHRNSITEISGLEKCPRIKKLWLFQNKIVSMKGLHAFTHTPNTLQPHP